MEDKISVVIPVYNQEKYLAECIESVRNQTLSDIEIILVNDGSTDNSPNICESFKEKDNRIIYISQENQGVSAARNAGIKHAGAEFLYFMDSDDTIAPDFLEFAYNNAITHGSDIVVLGEALRNRMPYPPALQTCAMFIKNSFLRNSKVIFPAGIQPCEDGLFSHQLIALTDKISFEPNCKYYYRHHENQNHILINSACDKVLKQIPKWFEILENFYTQNNLWQTKSNHLLKFIEHEPFEFRFVDMPFNETQKEELFGIIHKFIEKHNLQKYLNKDFSAEFRLFVKADSYKQFLNRLNRKKFIDKIFSIVKTRDKRHRVITILGVKVSLKI